MFPSAPDTRQARPQWRAAVRRAVDLVVAFATLEDPELDASAEPAHHVADPHPHRHPLRPAPRAGRPGVVPGRAAPCVVPMSHRHHRSDRQRDPHPAG